MKADFDSTERPVGNYALFALCFLGFLLALAGVIVTVPSLAVFGWVIFFLAVLSFCLD
jgi:ABC-type proline/glycine betaine transport system permease subunit